MMDSERAREIAMTAIEEVLSRIALLTDEGDFNDIKMLID